MPVEASQSLSFGGLLRTLVPRDFDLSDVLSKLFPPNNPWAIKSKTMGTLTWTQLHLAPDEFILKGAEFPAPLTVPALFAVVSRAITLEEREGRPYREGKPALFAYVCISLSGTYQDLKRKPGFYRPYVGGAVFPPALQEQSPEEWLVSTFLGPLLLRSPFLLATCLHSNLDLLNPERTLGWDLETSISKHCRPPFFVARDLLDGGPHTADHARGAIEREEAIHDEFLRIKQGELQSFPIGGGRLWLLFPERRFWDSTPATVPET